MRQTYIRSRKSCGKFCTIERVVLVYACGRYAGLTAGLLRSVVANGGAMVVYQYVLGQLHTKRIS